MEKERCQTYGFTLIEILTAMFIFSVIASTLFIAYRALFVDTAGFEKGMQRYALAESCFSRMKSDLSAIKVAVAPLYTPPKSDDPPDPYRLFGQTAYSGDVTSGTLRFASLAHVPLGSTRRTGIAEIRYYVQADSDGQFVLRRADRLYPFPDAEASGTDPVLCDGVKSLRFTYYDTEGEPHENWDSDSADNDYATPVSIRIELEIGDDTSAAAFHTRIALPVIREGRNPL